MMVIVYWWEDALNSWINLKTLLPYRWLLPIGVVIIGLYQTLNYWAIRVKDFNSIARTKVRQGIGGVITQIGLGWIGLGTPGLLIGDVVGRAAGIALLAQKVSRLFVCSSWNILWHVARDYRKFPILSMSSTLINRMGLQLPHLLLAGLYGTKVAGWYMLVYRIMGLPASLIGQAIAQVYLGEAAQLKRENPDKLGKLYLRTAKRLFIMGSIPIIAIGILGSIFFEFLFGNEWAEAGNFLLLLTPMFAIQFVVFPLSQTLIILERQELQLVWDVIRLILVFGTLQGTAVLTHKANWAIGTLSISMTVSYLVLGVMGIWTISRIKL